MNKLVDSKQKIEAINSSGSSSLDLGRVLRPTFEERHKRLTIYLEHDVYKCLLERRSYGSSQTKMINEALRRYFEN